jgi:hypothetical protein
MTPSDQDSLKACTEMILERLKAANDHGCLHASGQPAEARGTEQSGQIDQERAGLRRQAGLNGSNWIMKKSGDFAVVLWNLGVPDGI